LTALVVNGVIGSSIFGVPSIVAGLLGSNSVFAYIVAAAAIGIVVACFAEVASQFRSSGGPYLYARTAFGQFVGIEIGWLTWLVRLTASAANANLFVIYLTQFWPQASGALVRIALITLLVGVLAFVNYRGVTSGVRISNSLAILKVVLLVGFIFVGIFFTRSVRSNAAPNVGMDSWLEAVLVLIFAYGGFEAALLPTGEVQNPRRDVPFSLFSGLAASAFIYTLIQLVVTRVLSVPSATDRPLALAAGKMVGPVGAIVMTLAALFCVWGYLSGQMVNVPRLTYALAEQNDFPRVFAAVHSRFSTPYFSILAFTFSVWLLAVVGTFRWNVMLSALARLLTYGIVCAALPVLRRKNPHAKAFRLPAGWLFSVLGVILSLVLLSRIHRNEILILTATVAIALLNWVLVRTVERKTRLPH
jgi:basic amino acid/polyamine antiporter, APA family